MTHHSDPTAVRAAAERVRRANETDVVAVYGHYKIGPDANDYRQKYGSDLATLADAYLALTDPTPLTVEVLVEMGFVKSATDKPIYVWKNLYVNADTFLSWWVYYCPDSEDVYPQPRTAGELRQLLERMGK